MMNAFVTAARVSGCAVCKSIPAVAADDIRQVYFTCTAASGIYTFIINCGKFMSHHHSSLHTFDKISLKLFYLEKKCVWSGVDNRYRISLTPSTR